MSIEAKDIVDGTLVTSLATSPIWADRLQEFNAWLTTLGLIVGLLLAVARLVAFIIDRRKPPT